MERLVETLPTQCLRVAIAWILRKMWRHRNRCATLFDHQSFCVEGRSLLRKLDCQGKACDMLNTGATPYKVCTERTIVLGVETESKVACWG